MPPLGVGFLLSPQSGPAPTVSGVLLLRLEPSWPHQSRGPLARGAVAAPAASDPRSRGTAPWATPPIRPRSPTNRLDGPPDRRHPRRPLTRSTPPPILRRLAASSGASRAPTSSWLCRPSSASDHPSSASPSRRGPNSSLFGPRPREVEGWSQERRKGSPMNPRAPGQALERK